MLTGLLIKLLRFFLDYRCDKRCSSVVVVVYPRFLRMFVSFRLLQPKEFDLRLAHTRNCELVLVNFQVLETFALQQSLYVIHFYDLRDSLCLISLNFDLWDGRGLQFGVCKSVDFEGYTCGMPGLEAIQSCKALRQASLLANHCQRRVRLRALEQSFFIR